MSVAWIIDALILQVTDCSSTWALFTQLCRMSGILMLVQLLSGHNPIPSIPMFLLQVNSNPWNTRLFSFGNSNLRMIINSRSPTLGPSRWLSYNTGVRNRAEQETKNFIPSFFWGVPSKYTDCEGGYGIWVTLVLFIAIRKTPHHQESSLSQWWHLQLLLTFGKTFRTLKSNLVLWFSCRWIWIWLRIRPPIPSQHGSVSPIQTLKVQTKCWSGIVFFNSLIL